MGTLQYWEDFTAGSTMALGERIVTEEEIIAFAKQFDPQPFHINKEEADASHFGGLIASGWHTAAMTMRMMVDGCFANSSSMGSPGIDNLRWLKPVRPGDTLAVTMEVVSTRASQSRPYMGTVNSIWRVTNQHGEEVMTMEGVTMFGRRPNNTKTNAP